MESTLLTALKIGLACFLGAGIGTAVGAQLGDFWIFGALLGGAIGYLSYEFKSVLAAVKSTWTSTINWRPDRLFWRLYKTNLGAIATQASISMFILSGISWLTTDEPKRGISELFLMGTFISLGITIVYTPISTWLIWLDNNGSKQPDEWIEETIIDLEQWSPINVFIHRPWKCLHIGLYNTPSLILALMKSLLKLAKVSPKAIRALGRFQKTVFITIHSEARLICGVDSLLGACVGHFAYGNAIIGALAGLAFGVVNYLLVSKAILKLPVKTK